MELKKEKGGVIEILLWQRRYFWQLYQEYFKMFEVSAKLFKLVNTLRQAILSPLAMYELTEGNARDVHFAQTLPNEPLRLFFKHAQNVLFGSYTAELKGALTSSSFSSSSFTMQKFHETERVRKNFFEEFTTAYNALVPEAAAAVVASAAGDDPDDGAPPEPQKGKKGERQAKLAEFRAAAELAVAAEIDARMVVLTQDGTHQEQPGWHPSVCIRTSRSLL